MGHYVGMRDLKKSVSRWRAVARMLAVSRAHGFDLDRAVAIGMTEEHWSMLSQAASIRYPDEETRRMLCELVQEDFDRSKIGTTTPET